MGTLSGRLRQITIRKSGLQAWKQKVSSIEAMWRHIEQAIGHWSLPYPRLRVYQDGLPVCGRELEIVMDLAKAGSRNHQLLLKLKAHGATIMGTESPDLLLQEYRLIQQLLPAGQPEQKAGIRRAPTPLSSRQKTLSRTLLKKRDQAIGVRINATLQAGETGLLFLGRLHSLEPWLAKDISVTYPIYQPLGGQPTEGSGANS